MKLQIAAQTDLGQIRKINEDSLLVIHDLSSDKKFNENESFELQKFGALLVVADGMGGESSGEIASKIAIISIGEFIKEKISDSIQTYPQILELLNNSLLFANEQILEYVKENPDSFGMGTTAVVGLIYDNNLFISWVGDSRAYRYSSNGRVTSHNFFEGNLEILTNDHSLVWNEVLKGKMTSEEARISSKSNIITQSLGDLYKKPKPDFNVFPIFQDDIILLCSDGLNGMISDESLNNLFEKYPEIDILQQNLIKTANINGGNDNITLALCKITKGQIFTKDSGIETIDIGKPIKKDPKKISQHEYIEPDNRLKLVLVLFFLIIATIGSVYYIKNSDIFSNKKSDKIISNINPEKDISNTINPTIDSSENIHLKKIGDSSSLKTEKKINENKKEKPKVAKTSKPKRKKVEIVEKIDTEQVKIIEKTNSEEVKNIPKMDNSQDSVVNYPQLPDSTALNSFSNEYINVKDLMSLYKKLPTKYKNQKFKRRYSMINNGIKNLKDSDTSKLVEIKNHIYYLLNKLKEK